MEYFYVTACAGSETVGEMPDVRAMIRVRNEFGLVILFLNEVAHAFFNVVVEKSFGVFAPLGGKGNGDSTQLCVRELEMPCLDIFVGKRGTAKRDKVGVLLYEGHTGPSGHCLPHSARWRTPRYAEKISGARSVGKRRCYKANDGCENGGIHGG